MQKSYIVIAVFVLLVAAVFYFGYQAVNGRVQTANQTQQKNETAVDEQPAQTATESKTFDVSAKNFEFSPKEITVKKGDTIRINFTNTEDLHDWGIGEFNAKTKQVQAGASESIEFVADKTGSFEYYCSVPGHRARGMVGMLIVEE